MDLKDREIIRVTYDVKATPFTVTNTPVNGVFVVTHRDIVMTLKKAIDEKLPDLRVVIYKDYRYKMTVFKDIEPSSGTQDFDYLRDPFQKREVPKNVKLMGLEMSSENNPYKVLFTLEEAQSTIQDFVDAKIKFIEQKLAEVDKHDE